jgi:hypothetical protein
MRWVDEEEVMLLSSPLLLLLALSGKADGKRGKQKDDKRQRFLIQYTQGEVEQ